jgi:hypothetical protein
MFAGPPPGAPGAKAGASNGRHRWEPRAALAAVVGLDP